MNSKKYVSPSPSPSGMSESKERNSLMSSSLRDHSIKGCNSNSNSKIVVVKDQQNLPYYNNSFNVGFSWPPRSYGCSFCKREFRSAQALGGHMNVHRRDRARLRLQLSPDQHHHHHHHPMLNLNFSPNPNPNISKSPSPSPSTLMAASPPQLLRKWVMSSDHDDPLPSSSTAQIPAKDHDQFKFLNTSVGVGLSFQMGHSKEDLDLELRLGSYP